MFSIGKVTDVARQFHLPGWMTEKPDTPLLVHRGDLHIDGHLVLDNGVPHDAMESRRATPSPLSWQDWKMVIADRMVEGLVIDGSLTMTGSVVNAEGDFGPALLVAGNLAARSLVAGGSFIRIMGDATLSEAVYGHYNHGELDIRGKVRAPLYINDDHMMSVGANTFLRTGAFSAADYEVQVRFDAREDGPDAWETWEEGEEDWEEPEGWNPYEHPVPAVMRSLITPQIIAWEKILPSLCAGRPILAERTP